MEIFIGSSREHLDTVRQIEHWLTADGHVPVPWDRPGLFPPGDYTLDVLTGICRRVGAAVLIFGEDDRVWYRGDSTVQPRDNVLIEYGLFAGALGRRQAIICKVGQPRVAADLAGLTFIDLSATVIEDAQGAVRQWAMQVQSGHRPDPVFDSGDGRRHKLAGRWEGGFEQPDYPGGPLSLRVRMTFESDHGAIRAQARVKAQLLANHRGGPRDVAINLNLTGDFRHSDVLKLEYRSDDEGVVQLGSMVLKMNAEGTLLTGRFVGYGSISEAIISGTVSLKKGRP